MNKGGGRIKGSHFELETAKAIVKAFNDLGITAKDCYRTPGSGGPRFAKKTDPGDLVLSPKQREYFPFAIECKFYREISLDSLMTPCVRKGQFLSWWKQAVAATPADAGVHTLLVFRQNYGQCYCMFRRSLRWAWVNMPRLTTKIGRDYVTVVPFSLLLAAARGSISDPQ